MDGAITAVQPDGTITYRASALGRCLKALAASRLGYEEAPTPQKMLQVYERGHTVEDIVADRIGLRDRQYEVKVQVSRKIWVVGHVDGFRDGFLHEIKSQGRAQWDAFNPAEPWADPLWAGYAWQVSVYGHALGQRPVVVRALWEDGEVKDLDFRPVDIPIPLNMIRSRVLAVEAEVARGVLPELCDRRMYPCGFYRLHEDVDVEVVDDPQIEAAARDYKQASVAQKIAKDKLDEARAFLMKVTKDTAKVETATGVAVTTWVQRNPPSLNTELFERWLRYIRGPRKERFFRQTKSRRVKVTLPKEEGDGI